jgi:hypothetical protein
MIKTRECPLSTRSRHQENADGQTTGSRRQKSRLSFVSDSRARRASQGDDFAAAKSRILAPLGELRAGEVESLAKLNEHI